MQEALKQINSKDNFTNFKYLFEAVIGFYQKDRNILKSTNNYNRNNRGRR